MGLWDNIFKTATDHTFLKVFEWREDGSSKIVHKHPTRDAVITNGSKIKSTNAFHSSGVSMPPCLPPLL